MCLHNGILLKETGVLGEVDMYDSRFMFVGFNLDLSNTVRLFSGNVAVLGKDKPWSVEFSEKIDNGTIYFL